MHLARAYVADVYLARAPAHIAHACLARLIPAQKYPAHVDLAPETITHVESIC